MPVSINENVLTAFRDAAGENNLLSRVEDIEKISKDFYWYSPILHRQLKDKRANLGIRISDLGTLKKVISLCCQNKIPLQVRGAGTGNYGQLIPLHGGVVLDLAGLNRLISLDVENGVVRAEPGARLGTIETEALKTGWELRCMPSTWVKSSLGGFLCGGSAGIGSITYGGLDNKDNIKSVSLLTIEEEPRLLCFEERECIKALHTYGSTGILVEAQMRLGKKVPYEQHIFISKDWNQLTEWAFKVACDNTLRKREIAQFEWPMPSFFLPLRKYVPVGCHCMFLLVDEAQSQQVINDAAQSGIDHTHKLLFREPPRPPYLTDYTWNHTTLWAIKKDSSFTYLQLGMAENFAEQLEILTRKYPGEILHHLEFTKGYTKMRAVDYEILCFDLPLVKYKNETRLHEMMDFCQEIGISCANPHSYFLEEGGGHEDMDEKRQLKKITDPLGILNPGKMKSYPTNPFLTTGS